MLYSKYLFCVADTWKRKYLVYLFWNKIKYYVIIGERDLSAIIFTNVARHELAKF